MVIWLSTAGVAALASAKAASARDVSNAEAVPPAVRSLKIRKLSAKELVVRLVISNS